MSSTSELDQELAQDLVLCINRVSRKQAKSLTHPTDLEVSRNFFKLPDARDYQFGLGFCVRLLFSLFLLVRVNLGKFTSQAVQNLLYLLERGVFVKSKNKIQPADHTSIL